LIVNFILFFIFKGYLHIEKIEKEREKQTNKSVLVSPRNLNEIVVYIFGKKEGELDVNQAVVMLLIENT
jgi:hypothetical protein